MGKKKGTDEYSGLNRLLRSSSVEEMKARRREGSFRELLDDWRWIFSYSVRYRRMIVLYTVLGLTSSTFSLVSAVVSKYMIDIVIGRDTGRLWLLALLMISTMVFSLVFSSLRKRYSAKISVFVKNDIRAEVFDHLMDAEWMSLSRFPNGDLLSRFDGDIDVVASNAVNWIPSLVIDVYAFAASFFVILHYDPVMALIALLGAPVMLLAGRLLMRRLREFRRRLREANSGMMSFEAEVFYNTDTIKSFGIGGLYGRKMRNWLDVCRDAELDSNAFGIRANVLMNIIGMAVELAAFGYCLMRLWSGAITFGTMTLFLQQRTSLSDRFNSLVGILPNMLNSSVSAQRIRELTELPAEDHNPETDEDVREAAAEGLSVCMKQVDFSYEEGRKVISAGTLRSDPGEIIALIGASGEGKTTMIRLLLGLMDPDRGDVELRSGNEMRWKAGPDIRRFFSYVPQGNSMLAGTIAENLRMVKEDASDEELAAALETACAWDFVKELPDGMDTAVGERGRGLSEGQSQRIAIARAVLRGAPVLLLDEATSALDVATERRVLRNIMSGDSRRTVIVTTHRPSVLGMCKRVYRVAGGTVEELDPEESARLAMDF